jgi:hypothetical protein
LSQNAHRIKSSMMHKDQTHIKRNCSSTGIIPSNYKVGVTMG